MLIQQLQKSEVEKPQRGNTNQHTLVAGGVQVVVASAPSTGCGVLCVQVLVGHPPGDWAREGAFLCT